MTMGLFTPDTPTERRQNAARRAVELAVYRLVADEDPDAIEVRESLPGMGDASRRRFPLPLPGITAAVSVHAAATGQVREQVANARGAGLTWAQIARAIPHLTEEAKKADMTAAVAAWRYAMWQVRPGDPDPDVPYYRYGRGFNWRCRTCAGSVYEPSPEYGEPATGHRAGCKRAGRRR